MNGNCTVMELDLGRVEDRLTFSFERTFDLPTPEGANAACHAVATVDVSRSAERYDVKARVAGEIRAECHRCLEDFSMPIEAIFGLVIHRGEGVKPPPEMEEDLVSIPARGEERYDIFPRVREELILEIPIKLLCREDCRGVCVRCGANLNAGACGCGGGTDDPRWGALKKFLNGESKT